MNIEVSTTNHIILNSGSVIVPGEEYVEFKIEGLRFRFTFAVDDVVFGFAVVDDDGEFYHVFAFELRCVDIGDDVAVGFGGCGEVEDEVGKNPVGFDYKKSQDSDLVDFFGTIIPGFDRERVYPSHMRKIFTWYDLLVKYGENDFSNPEEENREEEKPAE